MSTKLRLTYTLAVIAVALILNSGFALFVYSKPLEADTHPISPQAQELEALFKPTDQPATLNTVTPDTSVVRQRFVTANLSPFADADGAATERLLLNLFDNLSLTGIRESVWHNTDGSIVWKGHIQDISYSEVLIVVGGGSIAATIRMPSATYQIRYAGNDIYSIQQVVFRGEESESDAVAVPGNTKQPTNPTQIDRIPSSQSQNPSTPIQIDVMVVWTPAAQNAAGGAQPLLNKINLSIADANNAYINSQINMQVRLVHTAETSYTESSTMLEDLTKLQNPNDGYMDEVHTLRYQYGADLVSLVESESETNICGRGFQPNAPIKPEDESYGFSVVGEDCTGGLTLAHEMGHNMGSAHDREQSAIDGCPAQCGSYLYSYGYLDPGGAFMTVMSYYHSDACPPPGYCQTIAYFSNPNVYYSGMPTGVADNQANSADNAHSIANNAAAVAAFRGSDSPPSTPRNLRVAGTGRNSVTLAWDPPSNPVQTGYKVYRWNGSTFAYIGSTPADTTQYADIGLQCNSGYSFQVTAYNGIAELAPTPFINASTASCSSPTATPTPIVVSTPTPTATPIPPRCPGETFTDVCPGDYFYEPVLSLNSAGIISGYNTSPPCETPAHIPCFRPASNVTRGQTSKIIALAAGFNEPVTGQTFADILPGSTFYQYIERLAGRGIINGYPCGNPEPCIAPGNKPYFRPNENVTRGQLSKIVSQSFGYQDTISTQTFQDVAVGSTFYVYIERLAIREIINGYSCGGAGEPCLPPYSRPYFRPANQVTRGQTAKIVYNARQLSASPSETEGK